LTIRDIYNKKTKGPTLMELFTATGKLKKFSLTIRDVRCVHHGWHGTHRYDIQVLATHASPWWHVCGITMVTHVWHRRCTHQTSLVVKKNFFSFPVVVNNSIKESLLVFLL